MKIMATTSTSPIGSTIPVTSVNTADLTTTPVKPSQEPADALYPGGIPEPRGTDPQEEQRVREGEDTDPTAGVGVEGEVDVWEARYSKRNFIGRLIVRFALTIGWVALAISTWRMGQENLAPLTWCALAVVVVLWVTLVSRMIQAHYSHFYRLTNRRLFVSTGVINRRRDMMELLRVKDVFTRQQSLLERWLGLGTVVVVPSEKELPTFYLAGVDDPKQVMDLIWHHARAERDQRSVKIDSV
jgi:membrane protein YdbS with pleckstrin-like domain